MILKASQRGGAKQLALHLLRLDENDHVEVHQVRGFVSANVVNALREAYAISRGTKCTQFLFSLSLNPPESADLPASEFERAIEDVERHMGLTGQPRIIVFHEKYGRRHAHCVWSRIEPKTLKAINLPHYKFRLQEMSRELFIRHSWEMPRGLLSSRDTNPLNFDRVEWQQSKRIKRDAKHIKQIFQTCWAASDSMHSFRNALEARGYYLAQGNRRGHVVVDWTGEIYSLSRWVGVTTGELGRRLGDPEQQPTVEETKALITARLTEKMRGFATAVALEFDKASAALQATRDKLVERQRRERKFFYEVQTARRVGESRARTARFRKGLKGIWDALTGRQRRTREQNASEALACGIRDREERHQFITRQLNERRALQAQTSAVTRRRELEAERWQAELSGIPREASRDPQPAGPNRRQRGRSPTV